MSRRWRRGPSTKTKFLSQGLITKPTERKFLVPRSERESWRTPVRTQAAGCARVTAFRTARHRTQRSRSDRPCPSNLLDWPMLLRQGHRASWHVPPPSRPLRCPIPPALFCRTSAPRCTPGATRPLLPEHRAYKMHCRYSCNHHTLQASRGVSHRKHSRLSTTYRMSKKDCAKGRYRHRRGFPEETTFQ